MENDEFLENENELQNDEVTSDCFTQVSAEDIQVLNTNLYTGFIGLMGGLGIITGCIVCILLKDIFKKK